MRSLILLSLVIFYACGTNKIETRPLEMNSFSTPQIGPSIYDLKAQAIDGELISLDKYRGEKILIVNTASKCGYTPQYAGLQDLHEKYGDRVTILAFPANNFGGQEPGSNIEIAEFCEQNYGVSFQLFAKSSVKGDDMNPIFEWLSDKSLNGWNNQAPNWNFCKYLVNESGELLKFYGSAVEPMSNEILKEIL